MPDLEYSGEFRSQTEEELSGLQRIQLDLQAHFGGKPVEPIHITVERFSPDEASFTDQCLFTLRRILENVNPFPIYCDQIIQFHARYWQQVVLRWRVQQTQVWRDFKENTSEALIELGCPSHFVRERHATCTALFMDDHVDLSVYQPETPFPMKLFTVDQVLISLLEIPGQFRIMETIELKADE